MLPNPDKPNPGTNATSWLNRTVLGAGLTSGLGDFCYEITTVILPGFLEVLGLSADILGLIEGIADAVASFSKMLSGYIADRIGHRKQLVVLGYALTPVGQVLIALAGGWLLILLGRTVSWFGKGLRGPLRDAIVIQAVSPATKGRAFGFHRAADSIGSVLGPLLGVALLQWIPAMHPTSRADVFRLVLWFSVIPGLCAALAFATLVHDPEDSSNPALLVARSLRSMPERFKHYLGAVGLFELGNASHSLLILAATSLLIPSYGMVKAAQLAGLLYVWRNLMQVLLSYPAGFLADRLGHQRMLVLGYSLGALTALVTAVAFWLDSASLLLVIFTLAGTYTSIDEALAATVPAEMVSKDQLVFSYGALGLTRGVAKFVSSASAGLIWTKLSPILAFGLMTLFMGIGTVAMQRLKSAQASAIRL